MIADVFLFLVVWWVVGLLSVMGCEYIEFLTKEQEKHEFSLGYLVNGLGLSFMGPIMTIIGCYYFLVEILLKKWWIKNKNNVLFTITKSDSRKLDK